jgi:hypothetical protein
MLLVAGYFSPQGSSASLNCLLFPTAGISSTIKTEYTTVGSQTWLAPYGVYAFSTLFVLGGGGSSKINCYRAGETYVGSGGGGGGAALYSIKTRVAVGTSLSITVGGGSIDGESGGSTTLSIVGTSMALVGGGGSGNSFCGGHLYPPVPGGTASGPPSTLIWAGGIGAGLMGGNGRPAVGGNGIGTGSYGSAGGGGSAFCCGQVASGGSGFGLYAGKGGTSRANTVGQDGSNFGGGGGGPSSVQNSDPAGPQGRGAQGVAVVVYDILVCPPGYDVLGI